MFDQAINRLACFLFDHIWNTEERENLLVTYCATCGREKEVRPIVTLMEGKYPDYEEDR